ncbi:unnamed protein product [Nippostrongylus brasiliensis]|uniref:Trichohyalin-like n=1 Tax=Nippostrongylus brasiliensis TaxID=27835 RepID=A0A0N4XCG3_NIPBR|nr:unnamed protein product [Nippostrongylus brasiliensis]
MTESKDIGWMYEGAKSLVSREDYLLGKKIDKNFEKYSDAVNEQKPDAFDALLHTRTVVKPQPSSTAAPKTSALETYVVATEDPLVAVKVKEETRRREVLENPLMKRKFQKMLKEMMAQKEAKTEKKKKKKKHKKKDEDENKKKSKKRRSRESEESPERGRSEKGSKKKSIRKDVCFRQDPIAPVLRMSGKALEKLISGEGLHRLVAVIKLGIALFRRKVEVVEVRLDRWSLSVAVKNLQVSRNGTEDLVGIDRVLLIVPLHEEKTPSQRIQEEKQTNEDVTTTHPVAAEGFPEVHRDQIERCQTKDEGALPHHRPDHLNEEEGQERKDPETRRKKLAVTRGAALQPRPKVQLLHRDRSLRSQNTPFLPEVKTTRSPQVVGKIHLEINPAGRPPIKIWLQKPVRRKLKIVKRNGCMALLFQNIFALRHRQRTPKMKRARIGSIVLSENARSALKDLVLLESQLNSAANDLTVEQRLQSNKRSLQRSHGYMEKKFTSK